MDVQMYFLQKWAMCCENVVDRVTADIEEYGFEAGYQKFIDRNIAYMNKHKTRSKAGSNEEFAEDMFMCALLYVDLLIRFGVFSDDTTD